MYIHFYRSIRLCPSVFFFFNDTATTEIYTLSLHDALPISRQTLCLCSPCLSQFNPWQLSRDRKSTRLNSSHEWSSYAVFCLKKKNSGRTSMRWLSVHSMPRQHDTPMGDATPPCGDLLVLLGADVQGDVAQCRLFFFFNDTATTEIYTLSLHDALPISARARAVLTVLSVAVPLVAWFALS